MRHYESDGITLYIYIYIYIYIYMMGISIIVVIDNMDDKLTIVEEEEKMIMMSTQLS